MALSTYWNPLQKELRTRIKNADTFQEAIALVNRLHGQTHRGKLSGETDPTYMDTLLIGLDEKNVSVMPTQKDVTIAWISGT